MSENSNLNKLFAQADTYQKKTKKKTPTKTNQTKNDEPKEEIESKQIEEQIVDVSEKDASIVSNTEVKINNSFASRVKTAKPLVLPYTISLESEVSKKLDRLVRKFGNTTRSKIINEALKDVFETFKL